MLYERHIYSLAILRMNFISSSIIFNFPHFHIYFSFCEGLTAKSDVYSFGVVMLELLSGRRARDLRRPRKEQSLVEWAKPYLVNPRKRRVLQIFDASIDGQYSVAAARRAAKIVYLCLATETEYRPIMSDVVKALERLQKREEAGPSQNEPRQNLHATSITVPEIEGEV